MINKWKYRLLIILGLGSTITQAQDCNILYNKVNNYFSKQDYRKISELYSDNSACFENIYQYLSLDQQVDILEKIATSQSKTIDYFKSLDQQGLEKMVQAYKDSAERARMEALHNFQEARRQEQLALSRQYLNTAKAIALKSINMPGEAFPEVKGLLAEQAYRFNSLYDGYFYESAIYNSLYYSLKEYGDETTQFEDEIYFNRGDIFLLNTSTGQEVYSVHQNAHVYKWEIDGLNRKSTEILPSREGIVVEAADLSPDGKWLLIAGRGKNHLGYAELIDLENIKNSIIIEGLGRGIIGGIYAPNGDYYFIDDNGYSLKKWSKGELMEIIKTDSKQTSIIVAPDNSFFITTTTDGKLFKWNIKDSYNMEEIYSGQNRITSINIINTGDLIVFGDEKGLLYLIENNMVELFSEHQAGINKISFSENGQFMATASYDQSIKIWNLEDLSKDPLKLTDHNDKVSDLIFVNDGLQVMASTYTRSIKFWPMNMKIMADRICGYMTRNLTKEEWQKHIPFLPYEKTCEIENY